MRINQISSILNNVINEFQIGESAVVVEDLSNIVDVGKNVISYIDSQGDPTAEYDSFIRKMIDQVGKVIFVDRAYTSQAPNIMKDGWEYGSILQKVRCELADARDNATWDLFNYPVGGGAAYPDPFELSKPDVSAKFFNSKATYEVPITLTNVQLKEAFRSASDMSRFISMIENRIRMKMVLCNDGLIMATISNLIGEKVASENNVVNLLDLYNATVTTPISAANALTNPDFLRFASKKIGTYKKYLAGASMLYNDGGYVTFTPAEKLKFVTITEFAKSMDSYLYSDTFHNEFVKLPGYEEVGYWQGSGTDVNSDEDRMKVHVKVDVNGVATEIIQDGVVAVMFDDEAAAVCNQNERVTSIYNPRGEYTNYFYKWDAMYMNDTYENCVVFVVNDYTKDSGTNGENAPATWDTAYAIANSPYYVFDITTNSYTQLTTSDASTGEGFSWATYKGKIFKKVG